VSERWFAWHPVYCEADAAWAWLKTVLRTRKTKRCRDIVNDWDRAPVQCGAYEEIFVKYGPVYESAPFWEYRKA
jgi:tetrahydromethanopterin S-methyltransferase subunit H